MVHRIKIIGTSHIAQESIKKINATILREKPNIVALELDIQRLPYLFEGKQRLRFSDIPRIGLVGFIFSWIGGFVQRKLGEKVGIAPGADIKVAISAAESIGAKIFLIDRPLEITLKRLSETMNFWAKLKFIGYLLGGFLTPAPKEFRELDLRKVPGEYLIVKLTAELKEKFPEIYKVIVEERDAYMASKIKKLAKKFPDAKIVVVVGAGHIKGLNKALGIG